VADWWAAGGITTVALASTGVDGIPLVALWETRGFEVRLVDPPPVQKINGQPTSAVHAGPWRPRLQTVGLLASACRPTAHVCGRRRDRRPRARWLSSASQHLQPRPKALTPMHLKRQPVGDRMRFWCRYANPRYTRGPPTHRQS
jgi:hypothetical protein